MESNLSIFYFQVKNTKTKYNLLFSCLFSISMIINMQKEKRLFFSCSWSLVQFNNKPTLNLERTKKFQIPICFSQSSKGFYEEQWILKKFWKNRMNSCDNISNKGIFEWRSDTNFRIANSWLNLQRPSIRKVSAMEFF